MNRAGHAAALAALVLTAFPGRATAEQEPSLPEARARVHFLQGVALAEEGAYQAALAEFRASYELRPLPVVLYNIGAAERALRRYADAVRTFRRYLAETAGTTDQEERRAAVRTVVEELEAVLGDVRVVTAPEDADVFVDGELRGRTPFRAPFRLEAGEHEFEVRLDGYRVHREVVEVRSRSEQVLQIELERLPSTPWYRQWWVWTIAGTVLAGAVVGTVVPLTWTPGEAEFGPVRFVTE